MREYELEVLEQYNLEIKGTRKMRGAFFCDTNEGAMLLRETNMSERRALLFFALLQNLIDAGFSHVDLPVCNKENELVTTSKDGTRYILKRWFPGKECNVHEQTDIQKGIETLAVLHNRLNEMHPVELKEESAEEEHLSGGIILPGRHLQEEFQCHTKEMKKIRNYIRKKVDKGKFEYLYLKYFDEMYDMAKNVTDRITETKYNDLYQKSILRQSIIHGDYNYHNILMLPAQEIAVTNFEHFKVDVQVQDLYYFLRKVMEKYNYDEKLGQEMLRLYDIDRTLTDTEIETVALKIAYPEKFWKIANGYYHSNKVWVPEKCVEKLEYSIAEIPQKIRFLENIFAFHL